jgi:hypothetical protein
MAALTAPAAAAESEAIGGPGANTVVGAGKGWTVWSEHPRGASSYTLIVLSPGGGVTSRPTVPGRSVPFDIDVGVDASGAVVATYSRCQSEPVAHGGANPRAGGGLPQYTTGAKCSIRILNLLKGTERSVPRAGSDASEVLPSLSGRKLAYIAVPRKGGSRKAVLMVRDMKTGERTRLYTGPRRRGPVRTAQGPTSVDTDGRSVTSAWRHRNARDRTFDSDVLVQRIGERKRTVVASATNTSDTPYVTALAPTLAQRHVHYLLSFGRGFCERRFSTPKRHAAYGIQNSETAASPVSAVLDGGRLVVVEVFADSSAPYAATSSVQIVSYPEGPFTATAQPGQICG